MLDTGNTAPNVTMISGLKNSFCNFWSTITIPQTTIWGNP
jgi:hypothetical protein